MGFLNSKTRIMDVVMTPLGRASLATGGLTVSYASFTDGQTYYDASSISGSYDDAVDRVFLESPPSLPQDTYAIVTDDTGQIIPVDAFGTKVTAKGDLFQGGKDVTRLNNTGSFSSAISSVTNLFQDSMRFGTIIASRDPLDDHPDLILSTTTASFQINNSEPFDLDDKPISVNAAPSLFFDKRLTNFAQFTYLPPTVKKNDVYSKLGRYKNIKSHDRYTYNDLKNDLQGKSGTPKRQRVDIEITDTSETNDIVIQLFETNNNGIIKLDAVDYGQFVDSKDRDHPSKRVIFYGKVFVDETGSPTFVNLFTMVID
jgi:hypothetical protein